MAKSKKHQTDKKEQDKDRQEKQERIQKAQDKDEKEARSKESHEKEEKEKHDKEDREKEEHDKEDREKEEREQEKHDKEEHEQEKHEQEDHADNEHFETEMVTTGFKWAGYGGYKTPLKIGITDDDKEADWFDQEQGAQAHFSIDGVGHNAITGGGTLRTTFHSSDGESHTEDMLFINSPSVGWIMIPPADTHFDTGSSITKLIKWTDADGVEHNDFDNDGETVCFTPNSMITTENGIVPAILLKPGDRVVTADNGIQTIRWVGHSTISPQRRIMQNLHPVIIQAHAFGQGFPAQDLVVSPQHRFCLTGAELELNFSHHEAFVPAIALVGHRGIRRLCQDQAVTYIHLLFDNHELIFAGGLACESFHPAPRILRSLAAPVQKELFTLFPELVSKSNSNPTARPCLKRQEFKAVKTPVMIGHAMSL